MKYCRNIMMERRRRALMESRESANLDVAECDPVTVVLQRDVTAASLTVTGQVLELTRCHPALPVFAPQLVLEELHAVQPVLHVAAAHQDTCVVPFARWFRHISQRCVQRVVRP